MNCPDHPEIELRRNNYYKTGFCPKCSKYHRMCADTHGLTICDLPEKHEGLHRDAKGTEWETPAK